MTTPPPPQPGSGPQPRVAPIDGATAAATANAWRATAGVVVAYLGVLLIAGLVGLLLDGAGDRPSAGAERAQLAVQAIGFGLAALLLAEGLRMRADASPQREGGADHVLLIVAAGVTCALGAYLAGPLVSAIWPELTDRPTPVVGLGIGSGGAADLGTVVVVAGLVPLGEELLFRGVLTGAWLRARRPVIAVLMSTALFGIAHVTVGPRTMVIAAILGALLAATLIISGSLGATVLAHATINAIALLEAGLDGTTAYVALVVCVGGATAVASRLSPLVPWPSPGGTLDS